MGSERNGNDKRNGTGLIMKTFYILTILISGLLLNGCQWFIPTPELVFQSAFDGKDIAILDFAAKGEHISQQHGVYTADRLTENLFLTQKFTVIDRIRVRESEKLFGFIPAAPSSADRLQKIGLRLKARYLILGNLYNLNKEGNFSLGDDTYLQITFRIISVTTGDVLGIATHKVDSGSDNIEAAIDKTIREIILKIPGVKE